MIVRLLQEFYNLPNCVLMENSNVLFPGNRNRNFTHEARAISLVNQVIIMIDVTEYGILLHFQ